MPAKRKPPPQDRRDLALPASFELAGICWSVKVIPGLPDLGQCLRDSAEIHIRAGLQPQIAAATFCHELVHALLYTTGKTDHDEREVDQLGALLHQFLVTVGHA